MYNYLIVIHAHIFHNCFDSYCFSFHINLYFNRICNQKYIYPKSLLRLNQPISLRFDIFCSIIQQLFLPLLLLRKYHQDNFISFCVVNNYFPYHSSFLQSSNETSISNEVLVSLLIILQYSFTSSDCLYLSSLL